MSGIEKSIVVIGVGNLVLSDAASGIMVVREIEEQNSDMWSEVEFVENYAGGLDILEFLKGRKKALLVDTIKAGGSMGEVVVYDYHSEDYLRQDSPVNGHGMNLPVLVDMGSALGYEMPDEILVYGIEIGKGEKFGNNLTEDIAGKLDRIIKVVTEKIFEWVAKKPD